MLGKIINVLDAFCFAPALPVPPLSYIYPSARNCWEHPRKIHHFASLLDLYQGSMGDSQS